MSEQIYALYVPRNGKKEYFYVGRTERAPEIRLQEHIYNARSCKHKEDVYRYIREHAMRCDIHFFEQEILCQCDESKADDSEFFYVVKLIRDGHQLQNMKNGDAKRLAAVECAASDFVLKSVADVPSYRAKVVREAGEAAARLRASINGETFKEQPAGLAAFEKRWKEERDAKRIIEAAKKVKRGRSQEVAEARHQAWLSEQRHLFEEARKTMSDEEALVSLAKRV